MKATLPLILAILTVTGCSMIPDYETPDRPVPVTIGQAPDDAAEPVLPDWQHLFQDPHLRALVESALTNNRDLELALLDVAEARALYGIERSALAPEFNVNADGTRQRLPADLSGNGNSTISSQYSVGLGMAAYELDLFGRVRSLSESALQTYLGTEEAARSARITLISEVANAYLLLLADQQKLAISEETLKAQQASVELVQRRYQAGLSSELAVRQAEIALETARTNRASFRRQVALDRNALSVLIGGPVPEIPQKRVMEPAVALLSEVPEGLNASVLTRRPDIRRAEHALRAANASIGAARAAFFPAITLTGSAGTASADLSGLFEGGSGAWSFSPGIRVPIFNAGRLEANLDVAEIRSEKAVIDYEKAIQTAFQEVADGLAARRYLGQQERAQAALVRASQRSLNLAEIRFDSGADDYLAVLDARRELLNARQALVEVKRQKLTNRITLYRALGGGEGATAES